VFPNAKVILVSIDTLRADHVGSYGYDRPTSPFLDRIAAEGVVFENAIAQSSWTLPSHAALFTSRYPSELGLGGWPEPGALADEFVTLAEVLQSNGFATCAFTGSGWVAPRYGLQQGYGLYDQRGGGLRATMPQLVEQLPKFAGERFFLFLHTYDVHRYEPPQALLSQFLRPYAGPLRASAALREVVQRGDNAEWVAGLTPKDVDYLVDVYDASIRLVDTYLENLVGRLVELGVWDDVLLIVTSDHGEEFLEHGRTGHGYRPFDEQIRVPLILRLPGGRAGGLRIAEQVRLIDVMPTVLDLLGIRETPPSMRGESLVPMMFGTPVSREAFTDSGHEPLVSLRTAGWKLIYNTRSHHAAFYDLVADPAERSDRSDERSSDRDRAVRSVTDWLSQIRTGKTAPRAEAGSETEKEQLRSLGYVE